MIFDPTTLSAQQLYHYLSSSVAPRPICLASTIDTQGRVNLSPFSFFNVFSSNPPIMIFSPVRRGRDNTIKHTLENIGEIREVVINLVNYDMVEQMSLSSAEFSKDTNEFIKSGFTERESERVQPPRVAEAPVAFECSVDQVISLGDEGGAGNLILAKVVMIHIQDHLLDPEQRLDSSGLDLVARMGGNWYCRAKGEALFEVAKPNTTVGIGVDALPESVRNSRILTGNDLGKLGGISQLPEAADFKNISGSTQVMHIQKTHARDSEAYDEAMHFLAREWLLQGKTKEALALVLL